MLNFKQVNYSSWDVGKDSYFYLFKVKQVMELKAKVVQLLPLVTGEGKNGQPWKKQEFILETDGQYPKKVCASIWGDKINMDVIKEGNIVNLSFDLESREYNNRWYTEVRGWKIELAEAGKSNNQPNESHSQNTVIAPPSMDNISDDLPF